MATHPPADPRTLYLIHVLTHATRSRLDTDLSVIGLSSFQYTLLSVIQHNEGLSSSRLSKRFHVTPQAMGETIIMLERRGLIQRTEDPAHRKTLRLSLTEKGLGATEVGDKIVAAFEKELFAHLAPSDMEHLRTTLRQVLAEVR